MAKTITPHPGFDAIMGRRSLPPQVHAHPNGAVISHMGGEAGGSPNSMSSGVSSGKSGASGLGRKAPSTKGC